MSTMREPKTEKEFKKLTPKKKDTEYVTLAKDYTKITDGKQIYCHKCDEFWSRANYYTDNRYASGVFPICKKCLLMMAEQRTNDREKPNETKDSVRKVLMIMDLPYYDELYEKCVKNSIDEVSHRVKNSPFSAYVTILKSLPQYKGKSWADGNVDLEDVSVDKDKIKKATIKRFGYGLSNEDYLFLQNEYEDWVTRYECNTKAQEEIFQRLCFKKLELNKATREGKATKDLDRSYQDLMSTANIAPKQNISDALASGKSWGQIVEMIEEERPIPEVDPELKDVDKIGLYIDVFYKGHMAKMVGFKNSLSRIYENFMEKYTCHRPEYQEGMDSEEAFEKLFGSSIEDDE